MLLTQLAGRTVIDSAVARHVGTVSDAVVDPVNGRLVALFMDANHTEKPSAVRADGIVGIGPYAVMLRGGSQPEVHDDVREDGLLDSAAIFGLEVVAEDGTYIGQVRDVQIDPATLQIERYLVNRSGWMRWPRRTRIGGTRVVSCSPELMVVARAAPTERKPEAKPRVADLAQTVSLSTREPGDG